MISVSDDSVQVVVARARCYSNVAQAALEISEGDIEAALAAIRSTTRNYEQPETLIIGHLAVLRQTDQQEAQSFYERSRALTDHEAALMESDFC